MAKQKKNMKAKSKTKVITTKKPAPRIAKAKSRK